MPGNFLAADTSFPELTDRQSSEEKIQIVTNYLYMLLEQLRYTLANLGADNFNDTELEDIAKIITQPVYIRLQDSEGRVNELSQTVGGMRLSVSNGDTSSTISLTANGAAISSQTIRFNGMVTFSDLSGNGTTTINGNNIKTGKINAIDIEGSTFRSILGSDSSIGGEIQMCYLSTGNIAGGIRLDDGGGSADGESQYRMFVYTQSAGGKEFSLKIQSGSRLSIAAPDVVYLRAEGGVIGLQTIGGEINMYADRINLNGSVYINGVEYVPYEPPTEDSTEAETT